MSHLKPDYWVDLELNEEQITELEKTKQTKVFLESRGHNYPLGTVLRVSKKIFAKIENKKPETKIGKQNRRWFGYEYCLKTD